MFEPDQLPDDFVNSCYRVVYMGLPAAGLSLAYFSKRTLNLNGLEYHFRGLFVQNLTKSDFFRPIFVQNLTMRKLPYFAKCDKTA